MFYYKKVEKKISDPEVSSGCGDPNVSRYLGSIQKTDGEHCSMKAVSRCQGNSLPSLTLPLPPTRA